MCIHLSINRPTSIHTYTALYTWKSFKCRAREITHIHQRGSEGSQSPNFSFDSGLVYVSLFTHSPWPRFEAPAPRSFLFTFTTWGLQPHEDRFAQTSVNLLKPVCKAKPPSKILAEGQKLSFLNSALPLGKGRLQSLCLLSSHLGHSLYLYRLIWDTRNWANVKWSVCFMWGS